MPKREHDIESLIRTIMFIYYDLSVPRIPKDRNFEGFIKYWEFVDEMLREKGELFWEKALVKVRSGKANFKEIMDYFDTFGFIDNEKISKQMKDYFS